MKPLWNSSKGSALVTALMITALVGALTATLVFIVAMENRVSQHHQSAQTGAYAADAGIECAIAELRRLASWQIVPDGSGPAAGPDFNDGAAEPRLPDGTVLDLARLTADRQANSDAFYPASANRPAWKLFAHAPLARMMGADAGSAPPYVVVWAADDADDADGDPSRDSNDTILVRAEAFVPGGGRRAVEATLMRQGVRDGSAAGPLMISNVSVVAWREAR